MSPAGAITFASMDDVIRIEGTTVELGGRVYRAWFRLHDGRAAVWEYDLRAPLGQDQRLMIVPGE